jgi:hypothetical protein
MVEKEDGSGWPAAWSRMSSCGPTVIGQMWCPQRVAPTVETAAAVGQVWPLVASCPSAGEGRGRRVPPTLMLRRTAGGPNGGGACGGRMPWCGGGERRDGLPRWGHVVVFFYRTVME